MDKKIHDKEIKICLCPISMFNKALDIYFLYFTQICPNKILKIFSGCLPPSTRSCLY